MTIKTSASVTELLTRLAADTTFPTTQELFVLSDLTTREQAEVRRLWMTIPDERRYTATKSLIAASETELNIHLGRFLRAVLNDESSRVRVLVLGGLWEETDEALIGPMIDMLLNDPSEDVRAAAASALGAYVLAGEVDEIEPAQAMRVEEALLSVLRSDAESVFVQCRALESIAYSGEVGVRQLIEDGYYSPDEEMRVSALVAMARSADIRWRDAAQAELISPDVAMRVAAANAVGELEHRDALPDLIELLDDEEKEVRLAVLFALGRIGGKIAIEILTTATASADADEAAAAEEALEEALFYTESNIPLFDESEAEWNEPDDDEW